MERTQAEATVHDRIAMTASRARDEGTSLRCDLARTGVQSAIRSIRSCVRTSTGEICGFKAQDIVAITCAFIAIAA